MAFNLIVLTGRLTTTPELKVTTSGVNVCSFTLAVDRGYGENKTADFIPCVAWRGSAEFVTKYFKKGSPIGIEGSLQTRKYQDKDGNNRTAFEVIVNNVQFIGSKNEQNEGMNDPLVDVAQKLDGFTDMGTDDDLPF